MPREPSKIMRQDPVPPGRYWLDVPAAKMKIWEDLTARNKGALQVDYQEFTSDISQGPLDRWFIFTVVMPVSWPLGKLAQPNTAPAWVQRRSDVVQRPEDPRQHPIDTTVDVITENAADTIDAFQQSQLWRLGIIFGLIWLLTKT